MERSLNDYIEKLIHWTRLGKIQWVEIGQVKVSNGTTYKYECSNNDISIRLKAHYYQHGGPKYSLVVADPFDRDMCNIDVKNELFSLANGLIDTLADEVVKQVQSSNENDFIDSLKAFFGEDE